MRLSRTIAATALLAALTACAAVPSGPEAVPSGPEEDSVTTVNGTVSYRERIALPPTAIVRVQVADVARADAPATVLVQKAIETAGRQPPIEFTLDVPKAQLQPHGRYVVQARIEADGRLLFINDRAYPVLTPEAPGRVEMVLRAVGAPAPR